MKRKIVNYLVCPACLPEENPLRLSNLGLEGDDITAGVLRCARCGADYPIEGGVARIVPASRAAPTSQTMRYEDPDLLSAYLWSHYADLCGDGDSLPSYHEWARQILPAGGAGLDIGCATGRFAFEMTQKCDVVIGVDRSENFVAMARRVFLEKRLAFPVREEGYIQSERSFTLPESWDAGKIEFIVADAHALPFRSGFFSCVASLNLIDKVPKPMDHILEVNRLARGAGAQCLISDPFSWSETASPPDRWMGGAPGGKFSGFGDDNIAHLLSGRDGVIAPPWRIACKGSVWWKIRNHRNHFELIRSLFVKAER